MSVSVKCQAAWCKLQLWHNKARQLRPHFVSGAFLPDKGAWLRYWRLYRWWRRCSEKNKGPTPMERLCKGRRPGRAELNSLWKD
jgi:hypothetical protein